MRTNGYQTYQEDEVLSASPLRLVQLLYAGALGSIASARRCLRSGDIRARSRAITKAMRIVTELSRCLNHEAGGALSVNLEKVYGYILRLLIEGNARQTEAPLAEAERLLSTLAEAWYQCAPGQSESAQKEKEIGSKRSLAAAEVPQLVW